MQPTQGQKHLMLLMTEADAVIGKEVSLHRYQSYSGSRETDLVPVIAFSRYTFLKVPKHCCLTCPVILR